MSGRRPRNDFTENLEAVARGVRRLEEIRDPILREAVAAALRLREREFRLDPASRVRMRNTVLATLADRVYGLFAVLGKPAPVLIRAIVVIIAVTGVLASATVASADSLPDDLLYGFKLAGEQFRLAIAISPEDRASVALSIADHRLDEAERLASSGREDAAIVATASYGASLAEAAADLASVEKSDPRTAALVEQLQQALTVSQQRVATTATKLATDPRTAGTAKVLASVSATAAPNTDSPATKIADQAAAITARLATVAGARANSADPKRTARPTATQTATPRATAVAAAATPSARPSTSARPATATPTATPARAAATVRPTPTPAAQGTTGEDDDDDNNAAAPLATPPTNFAAARAAADRAKEAADRAKQAAEKARRATTRTPSPSPTRR
jgi:hypothetical protein